jgi:DNA polymerase zeta
MEPESRLYSCPVVVLDFQSLYPSLVIAYNLCYTTMVGRPTHAAASVAAATAAAAANSTQPGSNANTQGTPGLFGCTPSQPQQQPPGVGIRMGVSSYSPPVAALAPGGAADPERLVIAPNGVAFLPQWVRPGVLPRLLHEILATRVMVKAAMKRSKADKVGRGFSCASANAIGAEWTRHDGVPINSLPPPCLRIIMAC